jgi:hypothetical protein
VFNSLALHGGAASLLWGHREAAALGPWRITRADRGRWYLSATIARANPFMLRQRPLLFTAPRTRGFWAWGIEAIEVGPGTLYARLGPPEQ